jgi:putative chitinase
MINRKKFFDAIRQDPFDGVLSQPQVDGVNDILDVYEAKYSGLLLTQLAYVFATDFHETAYTMQPIEEYGKGEGYPYGEPDPVTGETYYGRGYVQLTWKENYDKAGDELDVDLVYYPERALKPLIAAQVIFEGMICGWFTGVCLEDYINDTQTDYYNARRIVNGTDRADTIKGYAIAFENALTTSSTGSLIA